VELGWAGSAWEGKMAKESGWVSFFFSFSHSASSFLFLLNSFGDKKGR
jgi:hypothetical protein